jgi:hypothetical protein
LAIAVCQAGSIDTIALPAVRPGSIVAGGAEICLGYGPGGKRLRRRVSGATKAAVQDALRELRADAAAGITKAPSANYTVGKAAEN